MMAVPARAGIDLTRREIIATGDAISGGGRIGASFFALRGIDDLGRVLFTAQTSAGEEGLFRIDEAGVETVWLTTTADARPVGLYRARTNAGGRVIASGFTTTQFYGELDGYYEVAPGLVRPIVERGDRTPDGEEICALGEEFALNDAGAVAFAAWAAPVGSDCDGGGWAERLYVAADGTLTAVLRRGGYRVVGLTDDRRVIVSGGMAILAARDGRLTTVVSRQTPGPTGAPLEYIFAMASNGAGEVVFTASSGETQFLLRSEQERVVEVFRVGDLLEDGYRIEGLNGEALINDAGDVAFTVQTRGPDLSLRHTGVLVRATQPAQSTLLPGRPMALNDAGAVGLLILEPGDGLARWRAGDVTRLLGAGAAAPDGGIFATGGLQGGACLGADGRVATVADDLTYAATLVCADGAGLWKIARQGDPAPEGGPFAAFGQCAIQNQGPLMFLAAREFPNRPREWRVYRADAGGIEPVAGPGMQTEDGATIERLLPFLDFNDSEPTLALNAGGTVLVKAQTAAGARYVRAHPDGRLESVAIDLGPERPVARLGVAGLTDAGTVIAIVQLESEENANAIVASGADGTSLLAIGSDPTLPGGPYSYFGPLLVAGDRFLIAASTVDGSNQRYLTYSRARGFELLNDVVNGYPTDLTPAGRALIETHGDGSSSYLLIDDDGVQTLAVRSLPEDPLVEAMNDRVNVLFHTWVTPLLTHRQSFALSGPTPVAACPLPPTAPPPPTRTLRATSTGTPTVTPTPVVDCAADPAACSHLRVGTASGAPGDRVTVAVTLESGPWRVAALQNDLRIIPPAPFAATSNGAPACRVNPAIDKPHTTFGFVPAGCGEDCTHLRAVVLAFDNVEPIPGGAQLYECDLTIAAGAAAGSYPIDVTGVGASDPLGRLLPIAASPGTLDVRAVAAPSPAGGGAVDSGADDGCQVAASRASALGWLALLPAAILLRRRQRS